MQFITSGEELFSELAGGLPSDSCVQSVCCVILLTRHPSGCYRDNGPAEQLFKEMETKDATVYGSLIKGRAKVGRSLISTTKYLNLVFVN